MKNGAIGGIKVGQKVICRGSVDKYKKKKGIVVAFHKDVKLYGVKVAGLPVIFLDKEEIVPPKERKAKVK